VGAAISYEQFVERAKQFFAEIGAQGADMLRHDDDLFTAGVMDSLVMVAFLEFIEKQRGAPLPLGEWDASALCSIESAYKLI